MVCLEILSDGPLLLTCIHTPNFGVGGKEEVFQKEIRPRGLLPVRFHYG